MMSLARLRGTIWLRMWVNPGFTPYFPDHMPSLVITLPNTEIHYSTTWALRIIKGAQVAPRTNSKVSFQHKVTLVRSGRKPPSGITKGSFLRSFVTHDSWGFEKTLGDSSRWFSKEIAKEIPRKTKLNLLSCFITYFLLTLENNFSPFMWMCNPDHVVLVPERQ